MDSEPPDDDAPEAGKPGERNEKAAEPQLKSDSNTGRQFAAFDSTPWVMVDHDLFRHPAVSGNSLAIAVLALIATSIRRLSTVLRDRYGNPICLGPGQWIISERHLAEDAGATRKRVRTVLKRLAKFEILELQSGPHGTVVTLLKSEHFRRREQALAPHSGPQEARKGPAGGPQGALYVDSKREEGRQKRKSAALTLATEAIAHLNQTVGSKYQPNAKQTLVDIGVLAKQGITADQCRQVIDAKVREWAGTDSEKYLRPSTLFRPSKFCGYLADVEGAPQMPLKAAKGQTNEDRYERAERLRRERGEA